MFKKRKKVKKIVLVFITIIMTLGFYINFSGYTEASDTQTNDTVGLDHGTINPIYRPKWTKVWEPSLCKPHTTSATRFA